MLDDSGCVMFSTTRSVWAWASPRSPRWCWRRSALTSPPWRSPRTEPRSAPTCPPPRPWWAERSLLSISLICVNQSSHGTGETVETRTARKPVQIEPTVIRLNRVSVVIKFAIGLTFLTRAWGTLTVREQRELSWTLGPQTWCQVEWLRIATNIYWQ